ncbi:hypothetical protein BDN70DRAFT_482689 [Pholiota conissans]|uniref:Uncharacterized protein n=1 Tax=Pholiota conissans TaxID=109636 RepID=A0A9P6CSR7_9AGAR|nr:hypothetical protein BDN70DRAFT_482689 [Pholiota conissans]
MGVGNKGRPRNGRPSRCVNCTPLFRYPLTLPPLPTAQSVRTSSCARLTRLKRSNPASTSRPPRAHIDTICPAFPIYIEHTSGTSDAPTSPRHPTSNRNPSTC